MALGPTDLVLCSGTIPRHTPFHLRLEAAASAGYSALSLWGRDYRAARLEGYSDTDLAPLIADHGLVIAELDPAWWWTPGAVGFTIPHELDPVEIFRYDEPEMFRIADLVGARSLNATDVLGGRWNVDEGAAAFAALCDRAAEHGLMVHLEWLAWSRIPDLAVAWEVVRAADRPNGGLNVDMWHCARTGATPEELLVIPGERVLAVQVDDGPAPPEDDLVDATLHHRLLPGEGAFDLVGYLSALRTIGAVAPIGVEVFSDELHALGPMESAQRAAAATRDILRRVKDVKDV
jgi:sugar phosphate isomerase/epimerase